MPRQRVREVYHVVDRALLEQRRVALGRNLLYLPLHGRQIHHKLAGMYVGLHHHAVLSGVDLRLVLELLVVAVVYIDGVCLLLSAVENVPDQPRHVVALQCEDHLQVVAQVVAAQRVVERQSGLHIAAGNAADELHAGVVVEVDAGLVGLEVVPRIGLVLLVGIVPAAVVEIMSVLHGLNSVFTRQHTESELALMVAFNGSGGRVHLGAVNQEVNALHGNARAVVLHVA